MRPHHGTRPLTLAAVAALTAAALAWPATGSAPTNEAVDGLTVAAESPAAAVFRQTVTGPPNTVAMLAIGFGVVTLGIGLILLGRRRRRHARR